MAQSSSLLEFYPLVGHMCCTCEMAVSCFHVACGAIGRAVTVEVEAMRERWFMEEVRGQIILQIWG